MIEGESTKISPEHTVRALPGSSYPIQTLQQEFASEWRVSDCLKELVKHRESITLRAIAGKQRDDARGKRIMPDYELVHTPVEDEATIHYSQRYVARAAQRGL